MPKLVVLPRALLIPPPRPMRAGMDEGKLTELAGSIRLQGVLVPLLVMPAGPEAVDPNAPRACEGEAGNGESVGRYEIVDGHRRYLASQQIGLHELPCVVVEDAGEAKLAMMHAANMYREDVTAAEEGLHYLELSMEHGWGIDQLCCFFRRSPAYINERCDLWRKDTAVAEAVRTRMVSFAAAKEILKCKDQATRLYMIETARVHGLTANAAAVMVRNYRAEHELAPGEAKPGTPEHYRPEPEPERPRCVWCGRDDDPDNIRPMPVHAYHQRDLCEFLNRSGIGGPPSRSRE